MTYEAQLAETVLIRGHRGDRIDAYLARPLGGGPHPGVVIIHHMPGWDGPNKEIARRFAHHGFVTILPNLHFREGKATPEENSASIRAAGGMPDDRTMGDVQGAIDHLRALPYLNGKVGVIGYCSGGRQTYLAACTLRGIDAAIDCYGGGVVAKPEDLTARQPTAPRRTHSRPPTTRLRREATSASVAIARQIVPPNSMRSAPSSRSISTANAWVAPVCCRAARATASAVSRVVSPTGASTPTAAQTSPSWRARMPRRNTFSAPGR